MKLLKIFLGTSFIGAALILFILSLFFLNAHTISTETKLAHLNGNPFYKTASITTVEQFDAFMTKRGMEFLVYSIFVPVIGFGGLARKKWAKLLGTILLACLFIKMALSKIYLPYKIINLIIYSLVIYCFMRPWNRNLENH